MQISDFFTNYPEVAVAFSGGVDSAYLLYEATKYAKRVRAYYVKTAFQPQFELDDAQKLATQLHFDLTIIPMDILACHDVTENNKSRCYYCKKHIFSAIIQAAQKDGFKIILDGTNFDDEASDRPGMQALNELKILSPLRLCGLTKAEIRQKSKEAGLFTWNKAAYACLATRIPVGQPIDNWLLERTEMAENYLFSLGFNNFRVRTAGEAAKIEIPESQLDNLLNYRLQILKEFAKYYSAVTLNLEFRHEQ